MISSLVVLLGAATLVQGGLHTEDENSQRVLWEGFKCEYGKTYENEAEEKLRFSYFVDNLKLADEHQAEAAASGLEDHSKHGITTFFDLDLRNNHHNVMPSIKLPDELVEESTPSSSLLRRELPSCSTTPTLVDHTSQMSQMKNMGSGCLGASWAFATVSQMEADTRLQHGNNYNFVLSAEQLLQCVTSASGCDGGDLGSAYSYLQSHELEEQNNYPYTSYNGVTGGPCNYNPSLGVSRVAVTHSNLGGSETCMAEYVQNTGPLAVCIAASNAWYSYVGGVMSYGSCPTGSLNFCVQAVAVRPTTSGGYWKLKANVGTSFGEGGYVRISYGSNTCSIRSMAYYASTMVDL